MKGIIGKIVWNSTKVLLAERPYLICFEEKCMSGKIENICKLEKIDNFEINIFFISPEFFEKEARLNEFFTIREASKILGSGYVVKII